MLRHSSILMACVALAAAGCGKSRAPDDDDTGGDGDADADQECSDLDHDQYGVGGGCLGDDCDDSNPNITACDCGPDGQAHSAGCACDTLQPEVCYEGTVGTVGTGACAAGLRSCEGGVWTICQGQTIDLPEECDYEDNDCDEVIDDGVLGPCGDCSEICESIEWGPESTPFDPGPGNSSGIIETPEGWITLTQSAVSSHYIWIANSVEGTVSKYDTRTQEELGRYRTGPLGVSMGMWSGDGENPSRTSVNFLGDAYVANRAFSSTASATKIQADHCPDSNGDGVITTSTGTDDVLEWGEDDCVVWNTPGGANGNLGRSIAAQVRQELDGGSHEYVWLGLHSAYKYVEIDGDTGELTGVEATLDTHTPYGAAIDADGNLWSASLSSNIARFDTADPADYEVIATRFNYGITVDSLGNVWTNGDGVRRYRPADSEWDDIVGTRYENGGIAVDQNGLVWTHHDSGNIQRIDGNVDPPVLEATLDTLHGGRGIAVDSDGFIWAINWGPGVTAGGAGDVTVIDPAEPDNFETRCCDTIDSSYTYSDMTGVQLGIATAPSGQYEMIVEGCDAPALTAWTGIELDADLPAETGLRLEVRTATTLPELTDAPWLLAGDVPPATSPIDLRAVFDAAGVDFEFYLGVRLTLLSFDRDALPVVRSIGVFRSCEDNFG
jgi:hypothetical protein